MSGLRVLVVCGLVVLAGCGGLPFAGSGDATPTPAETDGSAGVTTTPTDTGDATAAASTTGGGATTTATATATATGAGGNATGTNQTTGAAGSGDGGEQTDRRAAGEAIVGSGANATVVGGQLSTTRLVRAHRAYFQRADSATRIEWGTSGVFANGTGTGNDTGRVAARVSVARTNDTTGRLRTQTLPGAAVERFFGDEGPFVGNATRVAVRGERSATARRLRTAELSNGSAPGSYRNASGAVFDKTSVADDGRGGYSYAADDERGGYSYAADDERGGYSYATADGPVANATAGNVTGMFLPILSATNLTYRGEGRVAGFEGYVYDADGTAAVDPDELSVAGTVTEFETTVVVAPAGYVRYVDLAFGVETGTGTVDRSIERALVAVDDTSVSRPAWLDRARANPGDGPLDTGGDAGESGRTDAPSAVLDGGVATLNVSLSQPTFDPSVAVAETARFQTERLRQVRVGPAARYDYPADAQRVEITLRDTDGQPPGGVSNRTGTEAGRTTTGTNRTTREANRTATETNRTTREANRTAAAENLTAAVWNREQQRFVPIDARVAVETDGVRVTLTGDAVATYQGRVIVVLDYERYRAFLGEAF